MQSWQCCVVLPHCSFSSSLWVTGPLWGIQSKKIYFLLELSCSFLFQKYQSNLVVCTECYDVLVSSQSCKLEFYFAKIGQNIYSSLSHGTEVPLLLTSPNRASVQRENVLEYPLFLDECRAFPICHLSTDKSPSLVSTCSQPPFVIWK